MPVEIVKYSCGHVCNLSVYGDEQARAAQRARITSNLCPKCRGLQEKKTTPLDSKKHPISQKPWESRKVSSVSPAKEKYVDEKKWAEEYSLGMPSLTGTEKQIAWAMVLRAKFFKRFEGMRIPKKKKLKKRFLSIVDANFWIDNRGKEMEGLDKALGLQAEAKKERKEDRERNERDRVLFGKMRYVPFSCGCKVRARYKNDETDFLDWAKNYGVCPKCFPLRLKNWRNRMGGIYDNNLPALNGSPKQVNWARKIREGLRRAFENLNDDFIPYFAAIAPRDRNFGDDLPKIKERLFATTDAETWIDIVDMGFLDILEKFREG